MTETYQQRQALLTEAIGVLSNAIRVHRPRRGGGFNAAVQEETQARKKILENPPCSLCTGLIIKINDRSVEIGCTQGFSPFNMRLDSSLPLCQNPECIAREDIQV